jgi:hypothetical protein
MAEGYDVLRGAYGVREFAPALAGGGSFESGGKPRALQTLREIRQVLVVPARRTRFPAALAGVVVSARQKLLPEIKSET